MSLTTSRTLALALALASCGVAPSPAPDGGADSSVGANGCRIGEVRTGAGCVPADDDNCGAIGRACAPTETCTVGGIGARVEDTVVSCER